MLDGTGRGALVNKTILGHANLGAADRIPFRERLAQCGGGGLGEIIRSVSYLVGSGFNRSLPDLSVGQLRRDGKQLATSDCGYGQLSGLKIRRNKGVGGDSSIDHLLSFGTKSMSR